MSARGDYLQDPDAIYRASFAAIRREAPIEALPREMQALATRLVHACAMPDIVERAGLDFPTRSGPDDGRSRRVGRCWSMRSWSPPASDATACRRTSGFFAPCGSQGSPNARRRARPRARPRRSSSGEIAWAAPWWRSAMRRLRCSACSSCWTKARRLPAVVLAFPVGLRRRRRGQGGADRT